MPENKREKSNDVKKLRIIFMGSPTSYISNILFQYLWKTLKKYPEAELVGAIDTSTKPPTKMEDRILRFVSNIKNKLFENNFPNAPFTKIVKKEKIPFMKPPDYNINSPEVMKYVENLKPSVIFVFGCDQIIKKPLLDKYLMINFHWSLLPKYKGHGATVFPLIDRENITGITYHVITEKLDSGDIVLQKEIDIAPTDTVKTLSLKLLKLAGESIEELLQKLLSDDLEFKKQLPYEGKIYTYKDVESIKLINWDLSSEEIERRFKILGGMYIGHPKFLVTDLKKINQVENTYPNGMVINISTKGVVVACGKGAILIRSIYAFPTILSVAVLKMMGIKKGSIIK